MFDPVVIIQLLSVAGLWATRYWKEQSRKRGWWTLFLSFVIFHLLSIAPVVKSLAYFTEKDFLVTGNHKLPEVDVIVVLGGGVIPHGLQPLRDPSKETASRLLYGLQMLKQSEASLLVLSGEGTKDHGESEAEVMALIADNLGADMSKIIIEDRSNNTWEHGVELNKLLENKNLKIGIVTSALHMKRSFMVFSKYFSNLVPLPTTYIYSSGEITFTSFIPSTRNLYLSSQLLYEILGLFWYQFKTVRAQ